MRSLPATIASVFLLAGFAADAGMLHAQTSSRQARTATVGSPELDAVLKELATYDGGIESAAVWKLRDYVYARRNDTAGRAECEAALLRFLTSGATPAAKLAASRLLRQVAGDTAVPALQAMLTDDRLADLAIYSLQQVPGPAAEQALLQSVTKTRGQAQIAVVAALGERRSAAAVPTLVSLLKQPALATTAAIALGRIGGEAAVSALVAARAGAAAPLDSAIASALLSSAERSLAARDTAAALRLYESLVSDTSLPVPIRRAAAIGRLTASGSAAELVAQLTSPDSILQQAAIVAIPTVVEAGAIGSVCALLPKLPEAAQAQVVAILPRYPADQVRPAVLEAARSPTPAVRLAALKALESVGNQNDVLFLARAAAEARGGEQTATRAALVALRGAAVNAAILAGLSAPAADTVKSELLLAASDRRIFAAKPLVTASLDSTSEPVRLQALRSLRTIGTPSDTPRVLDLLLASPSDRERTEAEKTVVALAAKIAGADGRARFVRGRLGETKDSASRVRLIGLLPMIGDNTTLPVLRTALDESDAAVYDAAVRALVAWPTSVARDDVMRLARESRNETHRLLAIAGLVRIVSLDANRDPVAAVADLKAAASFAWRPEEQRLVLGALPRFPCQDGLELATGFLREPSVREEAQAAISRIKARLPK